MSYFYCVIVLSCYYEFLCLACVFAIVARYSRSIEIHSSLERSATVVGQIPFYGTVAGISRFLCGLGPEDATGSIHDIDCHVDIASCAIVTDNERGR